MPKIFSSKLGVSASELGGQKFKDMVRRSTQGGKTFGQIEKGLKKEGLVGSDAAFGKRKSIMGVLKKKYEPKRGINVKPQMQIDDSYSREREERGGRNVFRMAGSAQGSGSSESVNKPKMGTGYASSPGNTGFAGGPKGPSKSAGSPLQGL